ncbi:MAG: nucleoside kinase [Hyphomonadaceae bacterium]|nr:nucleoside kinase [Clostridia bacterium]
MIYLHETDQPSDKIKLAVQDQRAFIQTLGVQELTDLNAVIARGEGDQLIADCEKKHALDIERISQTIFNKQDELGVVLIAGPSSSGKTTFSNRLRESLFVRGITCHVISTDDYFLSDNDARRKNGEVDWESLDIVDTELFDQHMNALNHGETIELPFFNFLNGSREWHGNKIKLLDKHLIVVEGIHGLNPKLAPNLPETLKYKLYVSPIPQMTYRGEHIAPSSFRLLRRLVRDHLYRAAKAEDTLARWQSVRQGEVKNIFPFIAEADDVFNSTLPYEPAVLREQALALLTNIPENTMQYEFYEPIREMLRDIVSLPTTNIPNYSLLREFIG